MATLPAPLPTAAVIVEEEPLEPDSRSKLLMLASHEGDLTFAMDEDELVRIADQVVEDYDNDRKDRREWEDAVKEALKAASQEGKSTRRGPWNNSADVRYPLITVGALQFGARAMPAIVKGDEVVSVKTVGQDRGTPIMGPDGQPMAMGPDGRPIPAADVLQLPPEVQQQLEPAWKVPPGAKASRALRVKEYMNTTIFYRMEDWESDTDHLLHQLPIVGCAFRKVWYDGEQKRQRAALIPALRLIAPMGAKSCHTAPRLTEEIPDVYPIEILEKMRSGFYRDTDLQVEEMDRKPRLLLEQHRLIDLDRDGMPEPYIVTLDHETKKVLRIEANFSPDSIVWNGDRVARIEKGYFYVKYDFFPHPEGKFYGIGLGHLLKHIGAVVNTAINQMIDAGNAAVAGGGFVGSGVRLTGSKRTANLRFEPGEYKTVEATGDQLRNAIVERTFPPALADHVPDPRTDARRRDRHFLGQGRDHGRGVEHGPGGHDTGADRTGAGPVHRDLQAHLSLAEGGIPAPVRQYRAVWGRGRGERLSQGARRPSGGFREGLLRRRHGHPPDFGPDQRHEDAEDEPGAVPDGLRVRSRRQPAGDLQAGMGGGRHRGHGRASVAARRAGAGRDGRARKDAIRDDEEPCRDREDAGRARQHRAREPRQVVRGGHDGGSGSMTRYVTANGWTDDNWDVGEPHRPDLSVAEHRPVKTGLVDARGNEIMRLPPPVGFGRDSEWQ